MRRQPSVTGAGRQARACAPRSTWSRLRHGLVTTVASDHACCMEDWKGDELWPALPGFGGTALLYPVLISKDVHKRGLSLSRIAEVAAAAPARAYNLYPRKGIAVRGWPTDTVLRGQPGSG